MKRKKRESLVLGKILEKIAPRVGASIYLEPVWGIAGQITFKSGKKSYFRYNALDLNPTGSSKVATDKDYSNLFMQRMDYPIVPGSKTFFSNEWADKIGARGRKIDEAYSYAKELGFPVVVKPNSGSQGSGVYIVHTKYDFYKALRVIFKKERVALIQRPVYGKEYRLVVLDDEVISAYERISLNVVGDGSSTIRQLLKAKQQKFIASNRDTRIKTTDPRIERKLRRQNRTLESVPQNNERIFLLDNANLSTGGDPIEVTKETHVEFKKLAIRLTRDMGLRLSGIDIMVNGDIREVPNEYWILEINASPGFDHYVKSGKEQERIVEGLYLKVLKSLDR